MRWLALLALAGQLAGASISIDCGSATDSNFAGGVAFTASPAAGVVDLTVRYGPQFAYLIPALDIPYIVTFHFLETTVQSAGARVFSVSINDQEVIKDLDLFAVAGFMAPFSRSVIVMGGQALKITFTASVRNAMVASIDFAQLFVMPDWSQ